MFGHNMAPVEQKQKSLRIDFPKLFEGRTRDAHVIGARSYKLIAGLRLAFDDGEGEVVCVHRALTGARSKDESGKVVRVSLGLTRT